MSKFEVGKIYRNLRMLDTDMRVTEIHASEPEYYKLEVTWLNRRNGSEFARDAITVEKENFAEWVKV